MRGIRPATFPQGLFLQTGGGLPQPGGPGVQLGASLLQNGGGQPEGWQGRGLSGSRVMMPPRGPPGSVALERKYPSECHQGAWPASIARRLEGAPREGVTSGSVSTGRAEGRLWHGGVPYTPRLTSSFLPLAFAPRAACSVPTTRRVSSRGPSWGLGTRGPCLPAALTCPTVSSQPASATTMDGASARGMSSTTRPTARAAASLPAARPTAPSRGASPPAAPLPPRRQPPSPSLRPRSVRQTRWAPCRAAPLPESPGGARSWAACPPCGWEGPAQPVSLAETGVLSGTIRAGAPSTGQRPWAKAPEASLWDEGHREHPGEFLPGHGYLLTLHCTEGQAARLLSLRWGHLRALSELPPECKFCSGRAWGAGFPLNEISSPVLSTAVGSTPA